MSRRLILAFLLIPACASMLLLDSLAAQNFQVPKAQLRAKGTITAMRAGILQVKTADGGQWLIKVPDNPRNVTVSGSAAPNWLAPGMFVKFTATFDTKGIGQQPLRQLQVFTPGEKDQLGAFPAAGGNVGNLFSDEPANKSKPKEITASFNVAGQVRGYRDGVMFVQAGRALLKVGVAEKCSIAVVANGYQLMRIGDSVTIDAWYPANQKALGRAIANRLDVTAKQPFARVEKPRKRPAAEKPESGKPAAEEKPAADRTNQ